MQVAKFAQRVRVLFAAFWMVGSDLNVVSVSVSIGWVVWIGDLTIESIYMTPIVTFFLFEQKHWFSWLQ